MLLIQDNIFLPTKPVGNDRGELGTFISIREVLRFDPDQELDYPLRRSMWFFSATPEKCLLNAPIWATVLFHFVCPCTAYCQ
jgi:hypothetical protein